MSEFWNYKMTWMSLTLDRLSQKKGTLQVDNFGEINLIDFYKQYVIPLMTRNINEHTMFENTDNPIEDFFEIAEYENLRLPDLYKLHQFIFNIDQCLKHRFMKFL